MPILEEFPPDMDSEEDLHFFEKQYAAVDELLEMYLRSDTTTKEYIVDLTITCINTFHSYAHWMSVQQFPECHFPQ